MIGVHYRAWNTGWADTKSSRLIRDPELKYLDNFITEMKKAISFEGLATNNKPVAFFLATDDPHVKDEILRDPVFSGRIVFTSHEIDRSTVLGTQNALIDWYLLGATEYIIGTFQSSFSEEASLLTTQTKKINIGDPAYKKILIFL